MSIMWPFQSSRFKNAIATYLSLLILSCVSNQRHEKVNQAAQTLDKKSEVKKIKPIDDVVWTLSLNQMRLTLIPSENLSRSVPKGFALGKPNSGSNPLKPGGNQDPLKPSSPEPPTALPDDSDVDPRDQKVERDQKEAIDGIVKANTETTSDNGSLNENLGILQQFGEQGFLAIRSPMVLKNLAIFLKNNKLENNAIPIDSLLIDFTDLYPDFLNDGDGLRKIFESILGIEGLKNLTINYSSMEVKDAFESAVEIARKISPDHVNEINVIFRENLSLTELGEKVELSFNLNELARRRYSYIVRENHKEIAEKYLRMQRRIADLIPKEYDRPVFEIRFLFGAEASIAPENEIGILGGTGPISDAHLVREIMSRVESNIEGTALHLFSLPPPRDWYDKFWGSALYLARLVEFARQGHPIYLASNTAHINHSYVSAISSQEVYHLPNIIAKRIKKHRDDLKLDEKVLILETQQGWDAALYSTILKNEGILFQSVDNADQKEVQNWIDLIKSKPLTLDEAEKFSAFTKNLAEKYNTKTLLLGCTELTIGIESTRQDLELGGHTIYDTGDYFADIILENLHKNGQ